MALSYTQLGAALLVLAVLAAGASSLPFFRDHAEAGTIGKDARDFKELSERFAALAKEKGGAYAFETLKRAELPPNTDLHLLGHVVGDELYRAEGLEGIRICTHDFRNACSHAIVIGALNEFGVGEATTEKIREVCKSAPGGGGAYTMCFHGLGHGVFAYFGYDIPATVDACKNFGTSEYGDQEHMQCTGGMVMELVGGGGHDREKWLAANEKYLDPEDPLAPCNTALIPKEVKLFCYTYITPRLFGAAGAELGAPDPVTFPKAFSFCDAIEDDKLRRTCWGSFGKEFVPLAGARDIRSVDEYSDETYQTAIGWCMKAAIQEGKDACVAEALASVFWGGENDPDASLRFCSLVSDASATRACYERLANDVSAYVADEERRTQLCAQLPAEYRGACVSL